MAVDTIMSRDVVTVPPDTALTDLRNRLHEHGFRHLLVVEDNKLVGVISDRDVLQALSPFLDTYSEEHRDVKTLSQPAHEIMRIDPLTIRPDTPIKEASELLLTHNISSLPVVTNEKLVGIVTTKDLLSYYTNNG